MEICEIERAIAEPESYLFAYPMRVIGRATGDGLLQIAKSRAIDPAVFDERPPFLYRSEVSSTRRDSHFTEMAPSTLRNFEAALKRGVALQISHDARKLPVGGALDGDYIRGAGERPGRLLGDFYIQPGVSPDGVNRDALIDDIRASTAHDNSVGFHMGEDGRYICTLCNRDLFTGDCRHIPGFKYPGEGGDKVLATARIEGALLSEVSIVFDGSTPDATILKAYRAARAGDLKPETARLLEARYRVALPAAPRAFAGAATHPPTQEADMAESTTEATGQPTPEQRATNALGTATGTLTVTVDPREIDEVRAALDEATRTIEGATARVATLEAEVARLTPLAKDGERYRADLISAALDEGVRALGDPLNPAKFNRDKWSETLSRLSIEEIRQMHEGWAGKAAERFPGGRLTVDEEEKPTRRPATDDPPLAAYA